jgi:hypothetical protein
MNKQEALIERYSTICFGAAADKTGCGNMKAAGHAFCFFHWKELPQHLKNLLNTNRGYANVIFRCKQELSRSRVSTLRTDSTDSDW